MNHCIRQIRTALSDNAEAPRYIETLPLRGYRFIASVEEARTDSTMSPQADTVSLPVPPSPMRVLRARVLALALAGSTLAVLLALAAGYYRRTSDDWKTSEILARTRPFMSLVGLESEPSISQDGKQIAFSWNGDIQNNFDIYVKPPRVLE